MRFKIDENVPIEAAELLRVAGYTDCHTVYDERLAGAPDAALANAIRVEGRALVTLDLDFADLRAYPPHEYAGLLVLRPRKPDRESALRLLTRALPLLRQEPLAGALWIVDEQRVRIRRDK